MTISQIKKELANASIENLKAISEYAIALAEQKRLDASRQVSVTKVNDIYAVSYKGKHYELKKHPRYVGFVVYEMVPGLRGKLKRGSVANKEFRGSVWNFRDALRFGKI